MCAVLATASWTNKIRKVQRIMLCWMLLPDNVMQSHDLQGTRGWAFCSALSSPRFENVRNSIHEKITTQTKPRHLFAPSHRFCSFIKSLLWLLEFQAACLFCFAALHCMNAQGMLPCPWLECLQMTETSSIDCLISEHDADRNMHQALTAHWNAAWCLLLEALQGHFSKIMMYPLIKEYLPVQDY